MRKQRIIARYESRVQDTRMVITRAADHIGLGKAVEADSKHDHRISEKELTMASQQEHDIVVALRDLVAKVGALPPSAEKSDVVAAVEDLREKLGTVGYTVGRPGRMSTSDWPNRARAASNMGYPHSLPRFARLGFAVPSGSVESGDLAPSSPTQALSPS